MENITLESINTSIGQLDQRINNLNDRINESNSTIRLLIDESNKAHRDINRQVDQVCRLISNCEKNSSITKQRLEDHLTVHKKDDERANINGIKLTSLIGNFGSAIIGAMAVLFATGIV